MKEAGAILVVSQDPHQADVRKQRLEDAGYEVMPAMNIQAVREACEKRRLQLVVIGYPLPPAEVRRVRLEVRQGVGLQVPILELRKHGAATLSDLTVIIHNPQKQNEFAERVRELLEV